MIRQPRQPKVISHLLLCSSKRAAPGNYPKFWMEMPRTSNEVATLRPGLCPN
jgi:hypothetical protein